MGMSRLSFGRGQCGELMAQLAIMCDPSSPGRKTFIPRMCLESKVLHILTKRLQMSGPGARATVASLDRLVRLRLPSGPRDLALDLLHSCGMMQQSEERLLVGREVQGSLGGLAIAQASKHTARRLCSSSVLPRIPGTLCLARYENHVPVGEPFLSDPASKRKDLAATIRLLSGHASR